ncbi:MAG: carboxypeptidase regulatory-like domain-containing protein [Acidobacteriota bacterium]|nr:carboxypeptidase regulatory-like domain-containing protein [Acidobacteriota bacterium]
MSLKALYFNTLILVSMVLISFGSQARAQESITVSIPDNISAATGSQILVPVNVTHTNPQSRIVSFQFVVYFNQNVITPCGTTGGNAINRIGTLTDPTTTTFSVTVDRNTPGRLGVAGADGEPDPNAAGFQGSGVLLNLCFTVVGQPNNPANCCTAINFSTIQGETPRFTAFNGTVIPTTADSGSFFVQGTTAASVNVSGRVLTANGRGLRGALVRLTMADGSTKTATSSAFGYYRFADIPAGQTVTIEIVSKRYDFQSRTVNLAGDISDVDFVAEQ